ncbi:MAG: hypothetical protein J2P37_19190, partial [Ktedonobacteraceae bacterium]|nr:hypothetical protein [Ktedonobacteraceae bacterium]
VPWAAILLNGVLLALITLIGSVSLVAAIGGFLYVLHFVFPLVVLVRSRLRGEATPAFRTPLPVLVLPLAFLGCFILLIASGWIGMVVGLAWLAIGLCAYVAVRLLQRRREVPI